MSNPLTTTPVSEVQGTFAERARTVLVDYLAGQGLAVGDGPAGEVLVPFDHDGRRLLIAGRVGATPAEGLWLQLITADAVAREHWPATLVAINRWNATVPCPRAVLRVGSWETDPQATLTLDVWLPFGPDGIVDAGQVGHVAGAVLAATTFFAGVPAPAGAEGQGRDAAGPGAPP